MTTLNLIAEILIRTQDRIRSIPSLTVNWLRVKIWRGERKILRLKRGSLGPFVAIVAVYPGTSTFKSICRLIESLESNGYSLLIVINENSESLRWFENLTTEKRTLILRPNIGADFGAYKCGFKYLQYHRNSLEVALIANDSLHYTTSCKFGLSPLLKPMSPINCLYMNSQSVVHAGSMLIKFQSVILSTDTFWDFWEDYYCTNSKKRIIKQGEHKLSTICGINTFRPLTETFFNGILPQPSTTHKMQFLRWARRSDKEFFACIANLDFDSKETWDLAFHFGLECFQVSNSLGVYLSENFNAPIKMDLVTLGLVTRSEFFLAIESRGCDETEKQELIEIFDRNSKSDKNGVLERIRTS